MILCDPGKMRALASVVVDTLKLARRLEAAGFPSKQAADTAEAISEAIGEGVVTREYLDLRLAGLKIELLTWMFGFVGIAGRTAGATGLSMNLVVIPPGGATEPHIHRGFETAVYLLKGRVETRFGSG